MTISNTNVKAQAAGNGVTTAFPFIFKTYAKADLQVTLTDTAGENSVLTLDSDYTVTLNANQDVSPGGTVLYLLYKTSGLPLPVGAQLTILSNLADLQGTNLPNGSAFFGPTITDMSDVRTILSHQKQEAIDRSFKFPVNDPALNTELPTAAVRAGLVLGFDVNGNVTVLSSISGTSVSAAMIPVVSAATVAAARALLGVGAFNACGRLTLTSGVPVTSNDVTGASTMFLSPYKGDFLPLYDGVNWVWTQFAEVSQANSDTTKSPAAVASNSAYDFFAWSDGGTIRCTRGPAWSSLNARGTGVGTTELELFQGRLVNKNAVTNGPAARRGLFVGSARSDGAARFNDSGGYDAASIPLRNVSNYYNTEQRFMNRVDSTDLWTYTTSTIRQANGNTQNKLSFFLCVAERPVVAFLSAMFSNTNLGYSAEAGIGLDTTTAYSSVISAGIANGGWMDFQSGFAVNQRQSTKAMYHGYPNIGDHYLSWNERSDATGTTTWFGDTGLPSQACCGLSGWVMG